MVETLMYTSMHYSEIALQTFNIYGRKKTQPGVEGRVAYRKKSCLYIYADAK